MQLGKFAGSDHAQCWAEDGFEIGERVGDAVGSFVEDHGLRSLARLCREGFEIRAAGAGFFRQESEKLEFACRQA